MKKSKKVRAMARHNTNRRSFLRIERLEDRMVLTGFAPVAANDSYHLVPDQTLDISAPGILANDTDAEGDILSASLFSGPAHGTLALDPTGSFQYTPEAGFAGIDSFIYMAADDTGHSLLAAVTLRVGNGSSPISQDDSFSVNEDQVLTIPAPAGVLHNDSDPDGDALTAALVTGPTNGAVSLADDGSFVYTPAANFHGSDSFVYQANDGTSNGNLATVSITVSSINDNPLATNDAFSLDEDTSLVISTPGVLANDTDADGDTLTASLLGGPLHGSLTLAPDGSFTYTPAANFHGVDGFSYLVSDGTSSSSVATVTLEVNSVNDTPVAANDEYTTDEDTALTIDAAAGLLVNDTDADGNSLVVSLVSGPAHGTLTLNGDGSFVYTPEANFNGVDGFSYVVNDGTIDSDVATVTLNVNAVNDTPVAANDEYTTDEDTALTIDAAAGLLVNDTDADGNSLVVSLVSGPAHGSLTLNGDGSFVYTPEANFNGVDGFSYVVNDGTIDSDVATVTLNVNAVNDTPVAANDEYTTDEDTALTIDAAAGLLVNDTDADGNSLVVSLVSGPAHGSLTLNGDGSFVYTPEANFNGVDGFSYVVNDGTIDSDVATVTLNVNAINDSPLAVNDEYTIDEDTSLTLPAPGILGNDSDPESDPLAASLVSGPLHGTLSLSADGSLVYTPEANFNGTDGFSYLASDGTAESEVATVTINVTSVEDPPLAANDEYTTDEDTPLSIDAAAGLLANDSDPDSASLAVSLVSGPMHGSVVLNADGSFSYTPSADFNGVDGFSYIVSDGSLESDVATVTINVNAVADPPVAQDDAFSTDEDSSLVIDLTGSVLLNDSDVDGDSLTAALVTGPSHGSVTLNADGTFSYTPEANFTGSDTFVYTANDGSLASNEATVTITVNPINDAPLAQDDAFSTDEDTSLVVDLAGGVLLNDSDVDGDSLTAALVTGPSHGSVTLNADGTFSYTPEANFTGSDSFVYTANDSALASNEATVTITVGSVNDAPLAEADFYTTDEDTPLTIDAPGVLVNDSDIDGDTLASILVSGPAHGTLSLSADGSLTYTPEANFNGSDTFVYMANDGSLASNEATVTITVNPVNDAPLAQDDAFSTDEDTSLVVDLTGSVLVNDSDVDGDSLTAALVTGPSHGSVTLNADGTFSYTPEANFNGSDSFVYTANDGSLASNEATVTITVNPVNDAPLAQDDAFSTDEDTSLVVDLTGSVLVNDSDIDGDSLTAALVTGPAHGSVTLNADGTFSYTPEANFNGSDSFVYTANDGSLASNEATVTITVNPIPDAPLAHDDAYSTGEDVPLTVSTAMGVLANDFDPQDLPLTAELVSGPASGTLTLNADGSFSYLANANFYGTDSFTYVANNGVEAGPEMTVFIVVQPLNDVPLAVSDDFNTAADGSLNASASEGVLVNDSDVDGDALTATLLWGPQHGSVLFNSDGSFSYQAAAGYEGTDTFKYQLNDGMANSNVATVTLHVGGDTGGENVVPQSQDDSYVIDANDSLTVSAPGVLGNDSDANNDLLSVALSSGPTHGALTLNADGSFSYTPETDFVGTDSFTYTANDGTATGNVATVTIDVQDPNVNHNPVANNDTYVATAETLLSVSAGEGVLANDTDADGNALTAQLVGGAAHGTVTLSADGSFSYQPQLGFTGADTFTYQATDGVGSSAVATVSINVGSAANHRPVAANDHYATTVDQPLSVSAPGLLANDADSDGNPLTAELFSPPQNGTIVLNADGSFVYTPAGGFQGRDSFIYRTFDGEVHSALAAVTIYVNPPPGSPLAVAAPTQDAATDEEPIACFVGSAIGKVMQHLELAKHGLDEDLLDSLAADQHGRSGNRLGSLLGNGRWSR